MSAITGIGAAVDACTAAAVASSVAVDATASMPSVTEQLLELKAGFIADANLSDEDLLAKVSQMSEDAFEEFLFPTKLKALVATDSHAAVVPMHLLSDSHHVPLPPATKFRESSLPGMSGAWSVGETKLVVDAVRQMRSTGCALDWQSIRDSVLPFRTAKAIEQHYYAVNAHVQQDADSDASAKSDDDDEEDDDFLCDLIYFNPFRDWIQDALTVDLGQAATVLRRAERTTQFFAPLMTPTLRSFLDGMQSQDQLMNILDRNRNVLTRVKVGAASSNLWGFCIGGDNFVPMEINTKLHTLFQSGEFSVFRHFQFTTGSQSHMMAQLEALLQTPGKCSHVTSLSFTKHSNRN
jgi:hypothetical protein